MTNRYIHQRLHIEKAPTTYRLLSRKLGLSVDDAKKELEQYFQSAENVYAYYILMGQVKGSHQTQTIRLVAQTFLENAKADFSRIDCIHIYSLSVVSDKEHLLEVESTLSNEGLKDYTEENCAKWGIIKGQSPNQIDVAEGVKSKPVVNRKPIPVESQSSQQSVSEKSSQKGSTPSYTSNYVSRKAQKADTEKQPKTAKRQTPKPVKPKETKHTYVSRKVPREKLTIGEADDEVEEVSQLSKEQRLAKKKELESLFDDDDSFMDDGDHFSDTQPVEAEAAESSESHAEPQDIEMTEAPEVGSQSVEEPQGAESLKESKEPSPETYVDEEGYTITKARKPEKPKVKKAPVKAVSSLTKDKSTGKKKQSTLMNFFGKK